MTVASFEMVNVEFRPKKVSRGGISVIFIPIIICIHFAWLRGVGIGPTSDDSAGASNLIRSRSQSTYAGIRNHDKRNKNTYHSYNTHHHVHDSKGAQQLKPVSCRKITMDTQEARRCVGPDASSHSAFKSKDGPPKVWTSSILNPRPDHNNKNKMGRFDVILNATRVLGVGPLIFTRANDINRSHGLGGAEITDDGSHSKIQHIFNMSREERAPYAFDLADSAKRAACRTGPFGPYLDANKGLDHQHPQLSGIKQISSMAGGTMKIGKAAVSAEPPHSSHAAEKDKEPIMWRTADSGAIIPQPLPRDEVKNLVTAFCDATVPGLITGVQIHADSFPFMRGRMPLSIFSAKLEVSKDAKEADIAKLMVASKKKDGPLSKASTTHCNRIAPYVIKLTPMDIHNVRKNNLMNCKPALQMPGATMDWGEKKGVPNLGAPLLEVTGKALSQDTIDSLSIVVSCSVNIVPGDHAGPITSYIQTESGVYNFAALTSDFAIALQTQKAATLVLSASPQEALGQWSDLIALISHNPRPLSLTEAEHEEVMAGLKAAEEILINEDGSAKAQSEAPAGEELDYSSSPIVPRSAQIEGDHWGLSNFSRGKPFHHNYYRLDTLPPLTKLTNYPSCPGIITMATAAVHTYGVYWPHSKYRGRARRDPIFQLLQFDDIKGASRASDTPESVPIKLLPIDQTSFEDITASLPWSLQWPGLFEVTINPVRIHAACNQIPPVAITNLAQLGSIHTSNSKEVAAIGGHYDRIIRRRIEPAINNAKKKNLACNDTLASMQIFVLNTEDGTPHTLASFTPATAASFFAPADTPTIPLNSRARLIMPNTVYIFPASQASRSALLLGMDKETVLQSAQNQTFQATHPRLAIPGNTAPLDCPPIPPPNTIEAAIHAATAAYASLTGQTYPETAALMEMGSTRAKKSVSDFSQAAICMKLITIPDPLITPSKYRAQVPQEAPEVQPNYDDFAADAFDFPPDGNHVTAAPPANGDAMSALGRVASNDPALPPPRSAAPTKFAIENTSFVKAGGKNLMGDMEQAAHIDTEVTQTLHPSSSPTPNMLYHMIIPPTDGRNRPIRQARKRASTRPALCLCKNNLRNRSIVQLVQGVITVSSQTIPTRLARVVWYTCLCFSNILLISHWTLICILLAKKISTALGSLILCTKYVVDNLKPQPICLYAWFLLAINTGLPIILLGTALSDNIIPWTYLPQGAIWMLRTRSTHPFIHGVYMHLLAYACTRAIRNLSLPITSTCHRKTPAMLLPFLKQFRPIARAYIRLKWRSYSIRRTPGLSKGSTNWGLKSKLAKQTRGLTIKVAFGEGTHHMRGVAHNLQETIRERNLARYGARREPSPTTPWWEKRTKSKSTAHATRESKLTRNLKSPPPTMSHTATSAQLKATSQSEHTSTESEARQRAGNIIRGGGVHKEKGLTEPPEPLHNQLAQKGMQAVNGYRFTPGDCFFDSVQYLTGFNSLSLRKAATQCLNMALVEGDPTALTNALEVLRSDIHGRHLTISEYIKSMGKGAARGGLWADIPIAVWTSRTAQITIRIYQTNLNGILYESHTLRPTDTTITPNMREIHILFTGPQNSGHYTPLVPLALGTITNPCGHQSPPRDLPQGTEQHQVQTHPSTHTLQIITLTMIQAGYHEEEVTSEMRKMFPHTHEHLITTCVTDMSYHAQEIGPGGDAMALFRNGVILRRGFAHTNDACPRENKEGDPPAGTNDAPMQQWNTACNGKRLRSDTSTRILAPGMKSTTRKMPREISVQSEPEKQMPIPIISPSPKQVKIVNIYKDKETGSKRIRPPMRDDAIYTAVSTYGSRTDTQLEEQSKRAKQQKNANIAKPFFQRLLHTSTEPPLANNAATTGTKRESQARAQSKARKKKSLKTKSDISDGQTTLDRLWAPHAAQQGAIGAQAEPVTNDASTIMRPHDRVPTSTRQSEGTVLTANVMGILSHEEVISGMLCDTKPTMFTLTETHTSPSYHHNAIGKRLRTTIFSGYTITFSSTPKEQGNGRNKGGVVFGITTELAPPGSLTRINTSRSTPLNGYMIHCTLKRKYPFLMPPLHIISVYMPENMGKRKSIYEYIRTTQDQCAPRGEDLIVMGDFNAAWHPEDRTGPLDEADALHRAECSNLNLRPLGNAFPGTREHTYHRNQSPNAPKYTSRIDDILIWSKPNPKDPPSLPMPERTFEPGGTLDHKALIVHLPCDLIPGALLETHHGVNTPPPKPSLAYPIKQVELGETATRIANRINIYDLWTTTQTYKKQILARLNGDFSAKNIATVSQELRENNNSTAQIDKLGEAIASKVGEAYEIMMETCTKAAPPSKCRFNRSDNRAYRRLLSQSRALKCFLAACTNAKDMESALTELRAAYQDWPDHDEPLDTTTLQNIAHTHLQGIHQRMATLREERTKRQREAAKANFQANLAKRPRKGHQQIFKARCEDTGMGSMYPEVPLGAAFHDGPPDGSHITTDPAQVKRVVHDYFSNLFAPRGQVVKTGRYLPEERESEFSYPWERPENPDNFKLQLPPGYTNPDSGDLLHLIMDRETYNDRLKHTKRSKAPGPDRLPNELLKILPDVWHETIHDMFILMWITGHTPTSWTKSTTILLHKKGDAYLPQNYRPIGLAGALYKLWTSTVTHVILHHSLRNNMLHVCQEGGILQRNTQRQLENLVNAFEDAHHMKQDIFLTYLDFSSAFNMCSHDQLLRTMYDIGVPTDAIEIVKDIYTGHTTTISLPVGNTNPITITRGTIQGDPLSPLLFIMYIEPLHRWLHMGGRGYKFGSLGTAKNQEGHPLREVHQLASLGFIDDTICLTRTKEDMAIQLRKIEAFSSPSGYNLPVNNTKSATTAILHGTASTKGGSASDPGRLKFLLSGSNSMTLNGQPIPYYPPDKTYKYLGVEVCPAMEWNTQLETTIEDVTKKGRQLAASMASPRQCLHIIRTCLKPKIAYAFGIVPYTMQEIGRLDRVLASITRKCCRLPRSTATASILLSTEKGGIGLISLTVDYATRAAESLTHALNDGGRLGATTKAMLALQRDRMGGAPVDELPTGSARYCTSLRKLQIMERHNLQLVVNKRALNPIPSPIGSTYDDPLVTQEDIQAQWGSKSNANNTNNLNLGEHPDGWFSRLLRHPEVTSSFMAPLLSIGIRHIGQLATASGTHLISTSDLALGRQVTKHHKQALNRLTIAVCGVYPPGITKPTQMKTSDPLSLQYRALPPALAMPQTLITEKRQGMHDIRKYLSRVKVNNATDLPPIPTTTIRRVSKKAQRAMRQEATHRCYGREAILLNHNHLSPAEVNEHSPPGSLATFWQQRQELTASLEGRDAPTTHWRYIANDPACTWETFRSKVCNPDECGTHHLPIQLLASLYDTQHTITALRGPTVQYKHDGIKREYYTATWDNTVVCRHHLPMIIEAYKHKGTILPNDNPEATNPNLSFLTTPSTNDFQAPDLVVVKWEDLLHPKEFSENLPNFAHLLAQTYPGSTPNRHIPTPPPPPTDAHLPDNIRQGIPTLPPCLNLPWETTRAVRSRVTFDLQACNPDLDIGVTKQYTLQEGLRHPGESQPLPQTIGTTFAHSPTGSYIGRVNNSNLDALRWQYDQTRQANPAMHAEKSTCFEKDVAQLLRRYDPNTKHFTKSKPCNSLTHPHTPTGALPPMIWEEMRRCLDIQHELFASPLDRSPHSTAYWSAYEEDQLFGANHDAFSRPWTGACQAYIGECPEANDKVMRHALGSVAALPESVTCIIVFLPSKDPEAPHMRHLTNPRVRIITTLDIGNECKGFKPPGHWYSATTPSDTTHPPMHMIAVTTVKGEATHLTPPQLADFAHATHLKLTTPAQNTQTPVVPASPPPIPRSIRRMLAEGIPIHPIAQSIIACAPHIPLQCTFPLRSGNDVGSVVAYTDGSCKALPDGSRTIGAAVYFPDTSDGQGSITITINPMGKGTTITINRAELSGIHQALTCQRSKSATNLDIYTDSACSLSLIQRILNSPWTLRDSKHLNLLNDILTNLRERAEGNKLTHFHKVRSHIGIEGNERADKGANLAALHPSKTNVQESSNNDPYEDKAWVTHIKPMRPNDPPQSPQYLSNLSEDIKRKVTPHHSGGQSTSTGLYARLWHSAATTLLPSSISRIWTDTRITWYQATLAFKARWGQLYTNKLAFRYGRAKDHLCPACRTEPDSIGHLLGGCQEATCKAMTIQRHNEGVRICHKAITRSSKFGGCYCVMDACPSDNKPQGVDSTRLPTWLVPEDHPDLPELANLRPDILIVEGLASSEVQHLSDNEIRTLIESRKKRVKIHILEIGFCSDLRHGERDESKRQQHERLCRILSGHSPETSPDTHVAQGKTTPTPDAIIRRKTSFTADRVIYHPPITLGRAGTLPASLMDTLKTKLQVNPSAADECAAQLTRHAVHYVEKFYLNRFASMGKHNTIGPPKPAPPRKPG